MHQWLPQEIVEVLEAVWTNEEQGCSATDKIIADAKTDAAAEALAACERDGYLERSNGQELRLTALGRRTAKEIIRSLIISSEVCATISISAASCLSAAGPLKRR